MRTVCVITSIFPPTPSVSSFAESAEFHAVIVIGDRKSPERYDLDGVRFIPIREQEGMPWQCVKLLPRDHYARKMLGYLEAVAAGADIVFETDDDNRRIADQRCDIWSTECNLQIGNENDHPSFVNVYRHFTGQYIWPRGLPLDCILDSTANSIDVIELPIGAPIGIWQGLANGDPDVDAIYRLLFNRGCTFDMMPAVTLAPGKVCPFNSQNTAFRRQILPLMYLPAFVTFRYTDILRSLVAQPILWAAGLRLCFTSATVFQDRNAHNTMRDFESEVPMYLTVRKALDTVAGVVSSSQSIPENLHSAYQALERTQIVPSHELSLVEAWLTDSENALTLGCA
jgi:hypothetical protein